MTLRIDADPPERQLLLCSTNGTDCASTGCCEDHKARCYRKNKKVASCRRVCEPGKIDLTEPVAHQTKWSCELVLPKSGVWRTAKGTIYWDCNGAGCDAVKLTPWMEERFLFPAQYAPSDPNMYGGPSYNESIWMVAAASDNMAALMGPDAECCGTDLQSPGGCGQCVLVRNPGARNHNMLAVVMKLSRCPPETKGCSNEVHLDLAVPGYDHLDESTANVCGRPDRDSTFITRHQSSVCSNQWSRGGRGSCDCSLLPNKSAEQQALRRGCELFKDWGWTNGNPDLVFKSVACPPAFEKRIQGAFTASGMRSVEKPSYFWLAIAAAALVGVCILVGIMNWILDRREQKRRQQARMQMARRKQRKNILSESSSSFESAELSDSGSDSA